MWNHYKKPYDESSLSSKAAVEGLFASHWSPSNKTGLSTNNNNNKYTTFSNTTSVNNYSSLTSSNNNNINNNNNQATAFDKRKMVQPQTLLSSSTPTASNSTSKSIPFNKQSVIKSTLANVKAGGDCLFSPAYEISKDERCKDILPLIKELENILSTKKTLFKFHDYQVDCICYGWLCYLEGHGMLNGMDPGLGKTYVTLGIIYVMLRIIEIKMKDIDLAGESKEDVELANLKNQGMRACIVLPMSLLKEWLQSVKKVFPENNNNNNNNNKYNDSSDEDEEDEEDEHEPKRNRNFICVYQGPDRDRPENIAKARKCRILLTTTEMMSIHYSSRMTAKSKKIFNLFHERHEILVVDEATTLKRAVIFSNKNSNNRNNNNGEKSSSSRNGQQPLKAKALLRKSRMAIFQMALTGTPAKDYLSDAASLAVFCNPDQIYDKSIGTARWADPREWEEVDRITNPQIRNSRIQELLSYFMFRPNKDYKNLPVLDPIEYTNKQIDPTKEQTKLSVQFAQNGLDMINKIEQQGKEMSGKTRGEMHRKMISIFTKMRLLCNSTALVEESGYSNIKGHKEKIAFLKKSSNKIPALIDQLENILANKNKEIPKKCIIFTVFRLTMNILNDVLTNHFEGRAKIILYHGGLSSSHRDMAISDFREDDDGLPVFMLMTPQSGGVGLNLQFASFGVFYDQQWNVSDKQQSEKRLHRQGQKNQVYITTLTTSGQSVESHIQNLHKYKYKNVVKSVTPDICSEEMDENIPSSSSTSSSSDENDVPRFGDIIKFFRSYAEENNMSIASSQPPMSSSSSSESSSSSSSSPPSSSSSSGFKRKSTDLPSSTSTNKKTKLNTKKSTDPLPLGIFAVIRPSSMFSSVTM